MGSIKYFNSFLLLLFLYAQIGMSAILNAQVVLDGSLGIKGSISGPDYAITADLGLQQGNNLFHSFNTFDINTLETAIFSGPNSISNIISRVTDGKTSFIDGKIQSTITDANFYFLNPGGIMFGPNASLDVTGSFHASAGDYLLFTDNSFFYADPAKVSILTIAPPAAFGLLSDNPATLTASGSLLSVPKGEYISLSGGNITLDNANLFGQSGHISLAAPGGTVTINRTKTPPSYNSNMMVADLEAGGMESGYDGGSISIVAGQLKMTNASIRTDTYSATDSDGILFNVDKDINISGGFISASTYGQGNSGSITVLADRFTLGEEGQILAAAYGTGNSGDQDQMAFSLKAREVNLVTGGQITSPTNGSGLAGNIEVIATESVNISGSQNLYYSGLYSNTFGTGQSGKISVTAPSLIIEDQAAIQIGVFGPGNANNQTEYAIDLLVDTLEISGGGQVSCRSQGSGNAGKVRVNAADWVTIFGAGQYFTSGIVADSYATGDGGIIYLSSPQLTLSKGATISNTMQSSGSPGSITLELEKMEMSDYSQINASSYGTAAAGKITITAADSFSITGDDAGYITGLYTNAYASGPGGDINITTPTFTIDHEGVIQAATFGTGNAGDITFDTKDMTIASGGRVSAASGGTGAAGNIVVNASSSLSVNGRDGDNNCGIFTLTGKDGGQGGNINIQTPNLSMSKDSRIEASTDSSSKAGDIDLALDWLSLANGALVVSQSTGAGNAGNINIAANESILISGAGSLNSSGLAVNAHSTGDGGKLTVNAGNLILANQGAIEAATDAQGLGGDIEIIVNSLSMSGDSWISSRSAAFSSAGTPGTTPGEAGSIWIQAFDDVDLNNSKITTRTEDADGGNIIVDTSNLLKLFNSTISTSVAGGLGNGGNITIDPIFVVLDNTSKIIANAYGGSGGNIGIVADYYLAWPGSQVTASSQLGIDGQVVINTPNIDLSNVLVMLPESGNIPELSQDTCATRKKEEASSLVITGQGGLTPTLDDMLFSNVILGQ